MVCQASLFSIIMMAHEDFSVALGFKMVVSICKMGTLASIGIMKIVLEVEVAENQNEFKGFVATTS